MARENWHAIATVLEASIRQAMRQKVEQLYCTRGQTHCRVDHLESNGEVSRGPSGGFGFPNQDPSDGNKLVQKFITHQIISPKMVGGIVDKADFRISIVLYDLGQGDEPSNPVEMAQIMLAGWEVLNLIALPIYFSE